MDTVLTNIHGEVFYRSAKHIEGDTRVKNRCRFYVWQYKTKDDFDGVIVGAAIGVDKRELADLQGRGVKFYRCNYSGVSYTISLEKFMQFAHPVLNREGDGEQLCVGVRHWEEQDKPTKSKKKVLTITPVIPLRKASQEVQISIFR
jgi:hypothetical protein